MIKLIIPDEFCDLNTYIDAERANRYKAAGIKRAETDRVCMLAKIAMARGSIQGNIHSCGIRFLWVATNRRKDPDNVAFAKKFVLDGLVAAGVLSGDGWKNIVWLRDDFALDAEEPRVEVLIEKGEST